MNFGTTSPRSRRKPKEAELRNFLFAGVAVLSMSLGACSTTGVTIPGATDPRVIEIQQQAANLCGWLPTATTVANIIATFANANGVVNVASTAAQGICKAITAKGYKRGASAPRYRGVPITASRVR